MGMVQMMLVAAAVKSERDRRASAARRRRAAARRKEAEKSSSSKYSYTERTYLDCVLKEIGYKDEELKKFFLELSEELKVAPLEDVNQIRKEADKCYEMLEKLNLKLLENEKKLRDTGIILDGERKIQANSYSLNYHYNGWTDSYGVDYYNNQLKNKDYTLFSLFNGCRITKEMIDNPNDTTFKDDYEYKKRSNEQYREEEERLKKDLERKEKRLKIAIFNRREKKEDITKIRERLDFIQSQKNEEEKRKQIMETYDNLTDDQKQAIRSYLDIGQTMEQTIKLIEKYGKECNIIEQNRHSKKYLLKALESVVEKKNMTEDDLVKIFQKLDRVSIRRARNEYEFTCWSSDVDGQVERFKPAIKGFIEYVYEEDPKFIENNVHEIHLVGADLCEETEKEDNNEKNGISDNHDTPDSH